MVFNVIGEMSTFIDFDEIQINRQLIIGDGAYGTVYRGKVGLQENILFFGDTCQTQTSTKHHLHQINDTCMRQKVFWDFFDTCHPVICDDFDTLR